MDLGVERRTGAVAKLEIPTGGRDALAPLEPLERASATARIWSEGIDPSCATDPFRPALCYAR